ncbi:hypothetical protein BJ138DRAFT_1019952, partial [Hygrophoropsis aurantiaca]
MCSFLWTFSDVDVDGNAHARNKLGGKWMASSLQTAHGLMKGPWLARNLRKWSKMYINDRNNLPIHLYGMSSVSRIEDESLAAEIQVHLQSIGKFIKAMDIVQYIADPEVRKRHGLKRPISLATAQRWMKKLDYRWK